MTESTINAPPTPAEIKKTIATNTRARLPLIILTVIILVAAVVGFVIWRKPEVVEIQYTTQPIERGDIVITANARGTLEPRRVVKIGAEISGRIDTVEVENNQQVTAGQILATFDPTTIKSAIELQNANLSGMDASVRRAIAIYDQAKADEARTLTLVDRGIVSRAEAESAISSVARAKADLDASRSNVARARASVTDVKTQLDKTVIVSPIDGVVLSKLIEPGQTVASSFQSPELFIIAEDLSRMKLNVWIDETDVGLVKAGQTATFSVSAWPGKKFEAVVETLDLSSVKTDNVVTYTAVLAVDNPDGLLLPGLTANATITTGQQTDILRVPNTALRWQPFVPEKSSGLNIQMGPRRRGGSGDVTSGFGSVHILKDGVPTSVRVETGRTDGRFTEITSGDITEGTLVIIGQTSDSKDDDTKKPKSGSPTPDRANRADKSDKADKPSPPQSQNTEQPGSAQ